MSKHTKTKVLERKTKRAAKKLLRSRHFFQKLLRALGQLGLVGEQPIALVLYIIATSCIFPRPLNVFVKGRSSSGKNWLVSRVLRLFPKEVVLEVTSATDRSWNYLGSAVRHSIVYLQERNEAAGTMDPIRLLISEGKLVRIVPRYQGKKLVTKRVVAKGPVAAVSTTTQNRLKIDDETRHISIWVDESEEQTKRILASQFDDTCRLAPNELEIWRMVHRILRKMIGAKVVFPNWFEEVAKWVYAGDVRVRRYFPAFIDACRTVCLIRSFQRGRKHTNHVLEVDFADFAITASIFDRVFVESLPTLGKVSGEATRRAVEEIAEKTGKPVSARTFARRLKLSMDQAYGRLRYAARAGVLRLSSKPEKSNRKRYWAAPHPRFVPDPEKLFHKIGFKKKISFVHPITGEKVVYAPKH